jgi:hypothetical protein
MDGKFSINNTYIATFKKIFVDNADIWAYPFLESNPTQESLF